MRKSLGQSDIRIEQQDKLWVHPKGVFSVQQIHYDFPVFGTDRRYSVRRVVVEKPEAVVVLPYDPIADAVVLIEQVRPVSVLTRAKSPTMLELCAGLVDIGEQPEQSAQRELYEECGLKAKQLQKIGTYWVSPGWTTEQLTLFCACVDVRKSTTYCGKQEECESIKVMSITVDTLFTYLDRGMLDNGGLLTATLWLARHRERLRKEWGVI